MTRLVLLKYSANMASAYLWALQNGIKALGLVVRIV